MVRAGNHAGGEADDSVRAERVGAGRLALKEYFSPEPVAAEEVPGGLLVELFVFQCFGGKIDPEHLSHIASRHADLLLYDARRGAPLPDTRGWPCVLPA